MQLPVTTIIDLAARSGATHKQNLGVYQFFTNELVDFVQAVVQASQGLRMLPPPAAVRVEYSTEGLEQLADLLDSTGTITRAYKHRHPGAVGVVEFTDKFTASYIAHEGDWVIREPNDTYSVLNQADYAAQYMNSNTITITPSSNPITTRTQHVSND